MSSTEKVTISENFKNSLNQSREETEKNNLDSLSSRSVDRNRQDNLKVETSENFPKF
jgi:hypothetical protein